MDKLKVVNNLIYKEAKEMTGINKRTLVRRRAELEVKQL